MIRRMTVLATLTLLLPASVSVAQVELKHKVNESATFTTNAYVSIDQTLTIAGNETTTKSETTTTTVTKTGERDGDGNIQRADSVKSLQISISGTPGEYRFDSVNPDQQGGSQLEMMRDVHKLLAKRTVTTTFDKDGKIVKIDAGQDQLANLPDLVKSLAASEFDSEQMKTMARQQRQVLPDKAVKKGDTWQRTSTASFGAGQEMEFTTTYTYEGTVESSGKQLHKISAKTTDVKFSVAADSPLPIRLKESKLKIENSESTVLFDAQLGRVMQSKESVRIKGPLTFEANGQELPSELDLTIKSEATVQQ